MPILFNWLNPPKLVVFKPVFNPLKLPVFNPGFNPNPTPWEGTTPTGVILVDRLALFIFKACTVLGLTAKLLAILLGSFS